MKIRHKIWHRIGILAVLAALLALLCSCSAGDVRLPQQVDLFAGQQFALASAVEIEGDPAAGDVLAAAAMADRYGVTVDFASSDPDVVSVDAAGLLQAVSPGQATVTVACDALGYTAQVQVTVQQPAAGLSVVSALQLATGETASLQPSVQNADPADLVYLVSDPAVASVDEGGNVTALAQGRTYITAMLPGSTLEAGCVVTVGTPVQSIQLSRPQAELCPGEMLTLAAVTEPEMGAVLTWQSDNPAVATVEKGVVTARAAGSAIITASADGQQAACRITVTADAVSATPESAATVESAATPENAATPETAATPESAATPETAATPESASTAESAATAETATSASSTPETAATPETAMTPESATAPEAATPEAASTPEGAATSESAATPETASAPEPAAATPESAAETATPKAATPETAVPEAVMTPESAVTPETTATPESSTPETATGETATPESAPPRMDQQPAPAPEKSWLDWLADAWARLTGG